MGKDLDPEALLLTPQQAMALLNIRKWKLWALIISGELESISMGEREYSGGRVTASERRIPRAGDRPVHRAPA